MTNSQEMRYLDKLLDELAMESLLYYRVYQADIRTNRDKKTGENMRVVNLMLFTSRP